LSEASSNFELMKNCDLIWAKSGTTTLETALFGKPMLIFYTGNWFSYLLVLCFKTVKNFGWPNLLAGYELVPELIQLDCRSDKFVKYTLDLLDVPALRQEISEELLTLRQELGEGDFVENCAQEVLAIVNQAAGSPSITASVR
jgi:lipid-A-disaccharide synthase